MSSFPPVVGSVRVVQASSFPYDPGGGFYFVETNYTVVYRMEHKECPVGNTHHGTHITNPAVVGPYSYGPLKSSRACYYSPAFGSNCPGPRTDIPPLPIGGDIRCGCLRSQVPKLWSFEPPTGETQPEDWAFGVYKVSEHVLYRGRSQVTFHEPPLSIFLGWFPAWVNEEGELDGRITDDRILQLKPWDSMSSLLRQGDGQRSFPAHPINSVRGREIILGT